MRASPCLAAALLLSAASARAAGPPSFPTPHDDIPNFAQVHTIQSVADGAWSDPGTWSPAHVPLPTDVVQVSHAVTYDSTTGEADVIGIGPGAVLRFSTAQDTRLQVGVLLVMPGGTLEVGTVPAPLPATLIAEIVVKNRPLNLVTDPEQYGTGLLCVDGTVRMHGAVKSPTFVRLAQAPAAGSTTLTLDEPVAGWRAGERLVLPDSAQPLTETSGVPHGYNQEELVIQGISPDGLTITFAPPLAFDHPGTTDEDGDSRPDYRPHVANLSRNVVVRSEAPGGTRGHVFLTHRAEIDLRYAAFVDLGRTTFNDLDDVTNHIGRYTLHLHHLAGPFPTVDPQYQYRLVGNSIREDGPVTPPQKWGIAIHDTHYGLVQDNVLYNLGGAGIVTEDGSESFNVFDHNFVVRILGNGGRDEHDESGRGVAREGVGFWFRGTNNHVRNNVAANMIEGTNEVEAAYGFKYNMVYLGDVDVPNFRGALTYVPGEFTTLNGNALPLLEFSNNETYGQIQGLTLWWLCTEDTDFVEGCAQSVVDDMAIWHVARYAYYGYPANNYTFDGLEVYGDPDIAAGNNFEFKSIFFFGDYATKDMLVTNAAFYDTIGLNPAYFRDGYIRVEDSFFRTRAGIIHRKSGAEGSCPFCDLPDADTVVKNNRFEAVAGQPLRSVSLNASSTDPANIDRLFVCDHQGVSGDSFEVFFPSQGNAPCAATRPDVEGFACVTPLVALACNAPPLVPSLSLLDAATPEGDAGPTPLSFTAQLSQASAQVVTVGYSTADQTATAGADYQAASGTLSFAPGALTAAVAVDVLGDAAVESDETFRVSLSGPVGAFLDDGDAQGTISDDDAPSLSRHELVHGSSSWQDLGGQSGTAGEDAFRVSQAPRASYEVLVEGLSGDASPAVLERLAADNTTVLQTGVPAGSGSSLALRWENATPFAITNQALRVRSQGCAAACAPDDVYRVRAWETTGQIARFNNSATQLTVLVLQNLGASPVAGHVHFWGATGGALASHPFVLAPQATLTLNTTTVPGLPGQGGSMTVAHDGGYGVLSGKAVALEPATGFTFDTPLSSRIR